MILIFKLKLKKFQTACTLEVYDNRNNQWTRLNNLNIDKINYSVAYVGENLMIIGGVSDSKRSLSNTVSFVKFNLFLI